MTLIDYLIHVLGLSPPPYSYTHVLHIQVKRDQITILQGGEGEEGMYKRVLY